MDDKDLIAWLVEQAAKTSWRELSIEIGAEEHTVYGWARRGSLPDWRRSAVEQARDRITKKEAA